MITKKQREEFKKVLGYHYANDVLKLLKKVGVKNRRGTDYGASMIRNVYNGLNTNKEIENAILQLYQQRLQEQQNEHKHRNKILGISK